MDGQERVAAWRDGDLPPYDANMGFLLEAWTPEGATLTAPSDPRWHNPNGVLHGGFLTGLMDSAMGLTLSGQLPPGSTASNVELQSRFLAPANGSLRARASVLRRGGRIWVLAATLTDSTDTTVATAQSTFVVRPPPSPPPSPPSVK